MSVECQDALQEVAADVLEKLAFMFADPADVTETTAPAESLVQASIRFGGPMEGTLTLLAPLSLGQEFAGNMLGIDSSQVTDDQARDALGELMNVLCGQLLTRIAGTGPVFSLHPPDTSVVENGAWSALLEQDDVMALLIDDRPVLLRAHIESSS